MKTAIIAALAGALTAVPASAAPESLHHRGQMDQQRQRRAAESIQAGAVFSTVSDDITSITGTFRVPDPFAPTAGPTSANADRATFAVSIYVSLGGLAGEASASACANTTSTLRAGVDVFWDGISGIVTAPFAWYQFGTPAENTAFGYAGFGVAGGDLVRITATAAGTGNPTILIENYGPDAKVAAGATPRESAPPTYGVGDNLGASLCKSEASWIVEAYWLDEQPRVPVALANFTDVTFTELAVKTKSGKTGDATGAKLVEINLAAQGGQLTKTAASAASLQVKRVLGGA
ncbi:concanavalin A-like lectin/glucanase domain-containing protein [Lasiosphaeria hispida]|uniref:Concanavalin A-like lectin/glucanase domain-containing protein n=1 Tax=Lasiosphaeria hispida TaxID=260671 RepID=A0AAJ0HQB1_9PEZI|nr:concanavalin A-like lectin/glucanase domain-containing protein [Lasiosphaeria hispida]